MATLISGLIVGLFLGTMPPGAQPSLQARINRASPGDTLVVNAGMHRGPLVVDRSLVLIGRNRPVLKANGEDHVVTINATDVTIVGFLISGSGTSLDEDHAGVLVNGDRATLRNNRLTDVLHGIYVKGTTRTVIAENVVEGPPTVKRAVTSAEARRHGCTVPPEEGSCEVPLPPARRGNGIHVWNSTHTTITHNWISGTRDGIYIWAADHTYAAHNTVRDVRYGLHFMYSDDSVFEHNIFTKNESGSALMLSFRLTARRNVFRNNRSHWGYGLLLQTMDDSRFVKNRITGNGTGIYLENSTGNVFKENEVTANFRGLRFTGSSMHNRFGRNIFRGNLHTAAVAGASTTNEWQIEGRGNYWGRQGLLDLDVDGISELPYRTVDLLGERRENFPYVDLLAGSPGLVLLAEALRRVPAQEVPAIIDKRPLLRPPESESESGSYQKRVLAVLLTLFGSALVVQVWSRL